MMTNPFADISDPLVLRAMVQDGVECERCEGRGWHQYWYAMDELGHKDCPTCNGTGHIPLPNPDLDALAACWCEGIFVRNWIWKYPKTYTHYVPNPSQYAVRGNWVSPPAYTTSPAAAMRLQEKYALNLIAWRIEGNKVTEWRAIQSGLVHIEPSYKATNANRFRALTEAALVAALTKAIKEENS